MYVYRIHNISCYECVPDRDLRGRGGDGPPGLCQGLHQENHLEVVRRQRPRRISECILVTIGQGVIAYSIWMTFNQLLKRGIKIKFQRVLAVGFSYLQLFINLFVEVVKVFRLLVCILIAEGTTLKCYSVGGRGFKIFLLFKSKFSSTISMPFDKLILCS